MRDYRVTLEPDKFYHIYNHAVGRDNIFIEGKNYTFFLERFEKYIIPNSNVYAYCLMPNHYHFLLQVKKSDQLLPKVSNNLLSNTFKSFFTSYTNSFNKVYNRRGSLFEQRFKRVQLPSNDYLINTILYIHRNPVKHNFVKKPEDWAYSSYNRIKNDDCSEWLVRDEVISLFGDIKNFIYCHRYKGIGNLDLDFE